MVFLHNIIEKMPDVLSWLTSFGINANLSRFSKYTNDIKVFFDTPFDTNEEKVRQFGKLNKAVYECYNIALVYEAFKSEKDVKFGDRLKRIINGNKYLADNTTDDARNIFFELIIASKLKTTGFDVDLSTDTDVIAKLNGINYYIECKRIASVNGLEANINKAGKQLQKRLKSAGTSSYGIIYVDISSAITEYFPYEEFPHVKKYKKLIKQSVKKFLNENLDVVERINKKFIDNSLGLSLFCSKIVNIHQPFGMFLASYEEIYASKLLPNDSYKVLRIYGKKRKGNLIKFLFRILYPLYKG